MPTSRLFLSFHDETDIQRKAAPSFMISLQGSQMHEDARLVVGHTTTIHSSVGSQSGLKGRALPVIGPSRRLDIVVTIEEDGGSARGLKPFSKNIGVTTGESQDLHVPESRLLHLPGGPLGRVVQGFGGKSL